METIKNLPEANDQQTNEVQALESIDFDPTKAKYVAAIETAKTMIDPKRCPESMWKPLQSELVYLSEKMMEWHENNDGSSEISQDTKEAYRKLDNDRADITIMILPKEATHDDMNYFYSKLDEAARLKREME